MPSVPKTPFTHESVRMFLCPCEDIQGVTTEDGRCGGIGYPTLHDNQQHSTVHAADIKYQLAIPTTAATNASLTCPNG
ncbi:unnamed protein product [Nezara viridula]|uniref:Uncharacterized protein n=1 Tax=Nezara viridula TaxID=85310 RepID=A0A9P0MW73_NEZVI|nr:unnamed protein product [Nezara viridula]